jgi:hypothetical protein
VCSGEGLKNSGADQYLTITPDVDELLRVIGEFIKDSSPNLI